MYGTLKPVYCDLIAAIVKQAIEKASSQPFGMIAGAGKINFDLDENGSMLSTTKKISVADINGRFYEITIKEVTR